jgi:hypothetical protein
LRRNTPSSISSLPCCRTSPLRVSITSEYLFRATDNEVLRWQVQAAGETVAAAA